MTVRGYCQWVLHPFLSADWGKPQPEGGEGTGRGISIVSRKEGLKCCTGFLPHCLHPSVEAAGSNNGVLNGSHLNLVESVAHL